MKSRNLLILTGLLAALIITISFVNEKIEYPEAKRVDQVDTYHGVKVKDPYRWMEDVNSVETKEWVKAQDELLRSYLGPKGLEERIAERIKELNNIGAYKRPPQNRNGRYFYSVSYPELKHRKIFRQKDWNEEPELLIDFNEILKDEESASWSFAVSPNGNYLIYTKTDGPVSWGAYIIYDIKNERFLEEEIDGVGSPNIAWLEDDSGFYYVHYGDSESLNRNETKIRSKIFYHKIGTSQDEDVLIYTDVENPSWAYNLNMSTDGQYLVITVLAGSSAKNTVFVVDTESTTNTSQKILGKNNFRYTFLGSLGKDFWFYTDHKAPNGKIIRLNIDKPEENPETIVPESDETIAGGSSAGGNAMNMIGDKLVLLYRNGPISDIRIYSIKGKLLHKVDLPTGWIGSGIVGHDDAPDEVWYTLNRFTEPSTTYRLDLNSGENQKFFRRDIPFDPDNFVTRYEFYKGKDGTKVPLFIAYKKGTKLDGNNPLYMYGYGFGGWVASPWYQPHLLTWLEMGGIYALPGIRGGGEYGEKWMKAGIHLNRQNAIDDYIAAAEYLIDNNYTGQERMIANGWSASGSLAAAAVMQRPDVFGAAMIGIPSLDLLRYHLFTPFEGWTSGYGSSENEEEFEVLYSYSPYHNIEKDQCYPPMLITVGEKDRTTPPQHAYKFVARMQFNQPCENPVMMKIVWGGGHGFGTTSKQRRETFSQEWAFLIKALDLDMTEQLK